MIKGALETFTHRFSASAAAFRHFEDAGATVHMTKDQIDARPADLTSQGSALAIEAAGTYSNGLRIVRDGEIFTAGVIALSALGAPRNRKLNLIFSSALMACGAVLMEKDARSADRFKNNLQDLQ